MFVDTPGFNPIGISGFFFFFLLFRIGLCVGEGEDQFCAEDKISVLWTVYQSRYLFSTLAFKLFSLRGVLLSRRSVADLTVV